MLTKDQALTAQGFHLDGDCAHTWRRNGRTQTWVTRPDDFRIPVKYGLRSYDAITHREAHRVHVATYACDEALAAKAQAAKDARKAQAKAARAARALTR